MSKSQNVPKRRPSLASPLPPTTKHQHQQQQQQQLPSYQRPSTAPNPGMMKRLMAKPAPLSSPSAVAHSFPDQDNGRNDKSEDQVPLRSPDEFYKSIRALDLVGKMDISMSPCVVTTTTTTTTTETTHNFLNPWQEQEQDISGAPKKQRNVLRRRPSGINKNTTISRTSTPIPETSLNSPQTISYASTPSTTTSPSNAHSSSTSSTPHPPPKDQSYPSPTQLPKSKPTPNNDDPTTTTNPRSRSRPRPRSLHPTEIEESATIPYYTVFGDTSGKVVAAGSPRDAFWDNFEGDWVSKDKLEGEDDGGATTGLTRVLSRTVSGKWKKPDSDQHQLRSKPSFQELRRSSDGGVVIGGDRHKSKKPPESPGGGGEGTSNSPSRRFWKLVRKISVGGLREKYQTDDPPPPVPPLPNDITNDPYRTLHSPSSDSSGALRGLKKAASASTSSVSSPTTPLGRTNGKTTSPPSSTSTQLHHPKLISHPSSSQPTTGPRPSTTTRCSSSHSSDVASSRFFIRTQSARSSTSSFGEEVMIPPPPLPKSTSTKTYGKTNETKTNNNNDNNNASRKLQQHIIPPSELIRTLSTSNFPVTPLATTTTATNNSSAYSPPSPQDDWTMVRSPSVEFEALSLPPPPRRLGMGLKGVVGGGIGSDRQGVVVRVGGQSVIPASKMLKMVNMSSEKVDERDDEKKDQDQDVPCPSPARSFIGKEEKEEEEEEEEEEGQLTATKPEQQDDNKVWEWQQQSSSHSDPESDRSPSPTIPSFSTSSAINSFPARRVSSSASRNKSSPTPISPVGSNHDRNSGGAGVSSSTVNGPTMSPSPQLSGSPQRSESRSAFGRVRHHLFGNNVVKAGEEEEDDDEFLNPLPSNRKSEIQISRLGQLYAPYQYPPSQQQQQQQPQVKSRKHHRHSSGSTTTTTTTATTSTSTSITKSRSAQAADPAASTASTSRSPIITFHPHRRSMSFNTPSSGSSTQGLFSSARSPSPFLSSLTMPQTSRLREEPVTSSLPPPPVVVSPSKMIAVSPPPPPTSLLPPQTSHRTRSSSNLRAGFANKKLSDVLFSSSSAASSSSSSYPSPSTPPAPPAPSAAAAATTSRKRRPSSISGPRTMSNFLNRSISVGPASNSNSNSNIPPPPTTTTTLLVSQPRHALTDQEKADKWNDLLDRSARAGGTLHLAVGSRLLGSDGDDGDDL